MELGNYSDDERKRKKKKKSVDACVGGKCGPKTKAKMSLNPFNATKSKYNITTSSEEEIPKPKQPKGGLHMNMRDLGNSPGDTQMQKQNSKSAITPAQETEGRKFNLNTRKEKKKMRLSGQ